MSEDLRDQVSTRDAQKQAKADGAAEKARAKAARPFWKKKRFILPAGFLLLVVIAVTGAGDGSDEAELVTDDPEAQAAADEAEEAVADADDTGDADDDANEVAAGYAIGETIAMGELEHTFHGARFDEGDELMGPEDGTRWLLVDVEVENLATDSEAISSLVMWRLVDHENRSKDQTITTDEQGNLDGELGAGRSMRGEIAYEVDEGQTDWELIFEPNFFGFGQGIYEFSADELE